MPPAADDTLLPFSLPSICQKKVTAAFDGGRISSDGGVLLLAGADKQIGLIDTLAAIIPDDRDPNQITHTLSDILRSERPWIGARKWRRIRVRSVQERGPGRSDL